MFVHLKEEYVPFKDIYLGFDLDNMFYRKKSELKSYESEWFGMIEPNNQPVFSFRYKTAFNKKEEEEFEKNEDNRIEEK